MAITVEEVTPDQQLHLTVDGEPVTLRPIPRGWCVKRIDDSACIDVVRMLYNWRLLRSPRRPGHAHTFVDRAWCYEGLGLETLLRTLGQALAWDGTDANPPVGWRKRAM